MSEAKVAYLTMEIALSPAMPTYTGGLGVLAGDTIRAAADLRLPMVAVSLIHRHGSFRQRIDAHGQQHEEPTPWAVEQHLTEMPARTSVTIEGRTVRLRVWRFEVRGVSGHVVPVYLLDAHLPENAEQDRGVTDVLYGGDAAYRLCQEIVLGIGGLRMLRALGHRYLATFHMNEGHASLVTVALMDERLSQAGRGQPAADDLDWVRRQCAFTTHTPVPAGHDRFPLELVRRMLGSHPVFTMPEVVEDGNILNMTRLALHCSHYVNAVSKKHAEVSRQMFPGHAVAAITNGVHPGTWLSAPFQALFDRHLPGWREDNLLLRQALGIPSAEILAAHAESKARLMAHINQHAGAGFDPGVMTIGFARRATGYKRATLLLSDPQRLQRIAEQAGSLQVVYAGKAHQHDHEGKELIKRIVQAGSSLAPAVKLVYLENYDLTLASLVIPGVDIWLNNPRPPLEASGTSGMKAAMNGVPNFSILDGWWIEGHLEGVTGWAIGRGAAAPEGEADSASDAASLYDTLERVILPMFYRDRDRFVDVMRHAIALNGAFFNTQRMLQEYVVQAYFR